MTIERATRLSEYPGAEGTKTYEGTRMDLAHQITKAREQNDHRLIVILCRRFDYAFPSSGLVPIERAVRDCFRKKLIEAKKELKSKCPVCGGPMSESLCCDDLFRPYCAKCNRTYTPRGYDDEDDYGKEWIAQTWNGSTEPIEIIRVA